MATELRHKCPVCGYPELHEKPRTRGRSPSYEICPSCGFQFGVSDDDDGFSYRQWREKWSAAGMKWSSKMPEPGGWDAMAQLKTIRNSRPTG